MKNNNKKKGFTLTEVLVVVLVIAVLAAIAYPMYTRSITKSKAVEAINLLEMVRNKQLQKFARDHEYYTDLSKITQLTSDSSLVTVEGETLKVNGYVLSVNPDKNCMSAYYKKGNTEFTLSTSYETAGLGCSGDICKSFGDIVGSATDVCGCTKTCDSGFTLDQASCSCVCNLGCATAGSCSSPSLSLPTTQSCGNGGSQTRVCTPSCNGGDCGAWGSCTSQTCEESLKPAASQSCGTCGTQSRTVSCNNSTGGWQTGAWSACTGDTCSCSEASKPAASQACGNCNKGTQTRTVTCNTSTYTWTTGPWTTCSGGGECALGDTKLAMCGTNTGYHQSGTESFIYQNLTCTSSCTWPSVTPCNSCVESPNCGKKFANGTIGACYCTQMADTKDCGNSMPIDSQSCGNCDTGTQTRTVTCDTNTGTWDIGSWSACTGGGECAAGAIQTCGSGGTKTCSSSCTWGSCADCSDFSYLVKHKSICCPQISMDQDDGTCYTRTWTHFGGQSIGYGGCYAPESGTQSCMADSSDRYMCTEDTDAFIPCTSTGDVCACMLCGGNGSDAFINTVYYKCSISNNGW